MGHALVQCKRGVHTKLQAELTAKVAAAAVTATAYSFACVLDCEAEWLIQYWRANIVNNHPQQAKAEVSCRNAKAYTQSPTPAAQITC